MLYKIEEIVDSILDLYRSKGQSLYFGENVTQLQHALQAAKLAERDGSDDETILAAFLHDIGHICQEDLSPDELMDSLGALDHENLGVIFLRRMGFSHKVCRLIASHVAAKRYLTFAFPEYFEKLSDASKKTLEYQGGVMNEKEAESFRNDIWFDEFIRFRNWDEEAKSNNPEKEDLSNIREIMLKHLVVQLTF